MTAREMRAVFLPLVFLSVIAAIAALQVQRPASLWRLRWRSGPSDDGHKQHQLHEFAKGLEMTMDGGIAGRRKTVRTVGGLYMSSAAPSSPDMSAGANLLIKKGKVKDATALRKEVDEQGAAHYINKFLVDKATYPVGVTTPKSFYNVTTVSRSSLSIMPEINYKTKTGFIIGMPPPEIMGGVLRDAGARGIIVSVDKRSGGVPVEEFERFAREQSRARIFTPGPVPVVFHDFLVDTIQLDQAAAMGASAVTIYPDFVPAGSLKQWVQRSTELGVEAVVMVKTTQEGLDAIAAGARVLCLHSLEEDELVAVRNTLPSLASNPSLVIGARLRPHNQFSMYEEIDTCWLLRDNAFSFVWPSPDAVYATGTGDLYGVVAAMRAKSSREYLSPRQYLMDRKKEGATEYLGDILY